MINQTYNAGFIYANKKDNSKYSSKDILNGYLASVVISLHLSLNLRYFTKGFVSSAVGHELLLLNTVIAATVGAFASFSSTLLMRKPEIDRGIEIYEDE